MSAAARSLRVYLLPAGGGSSSSAGDPPPGTVLTMGRYPGQLSLPVLRTFASSVLALLTVEAKLAPFISDFTIVGMT
jgi:hypothetical protein